jgi:hypothetical protein
LLILPSPAWPSGLTAIALCWPPGTMTGTSSGGRDAARLSDDAEAVIGVAGPTGGDSQADR